MSSLTNQQSSTKSMSGLSNTYSTDIVCNNFTCDTSFTISPGCVITLPSNSIPDTALSTNVAFRNQANTFTQTNTFNGATDFNVRTKNFAYEAVVFPADFRALDSTQTYPTQWYQVGTLSQIIANYNSGTIQFGTKTSGGVLLEHIIIRNGNETVLQGTSNELQILGTAVNVNGVCSFTNTTTPVITQAIALSDNTTKISTTAFVKGQGYITASALIPYALLAPTTQTFSGNNNFPTQLTTDNSTLVATTAYVKNQGYITSASLSGYALLAPSTTQTFAGTASTNFTNSAIFSVGLQSNNNITLYSIGGGGQTSNIQQNNSGLNIGNVDISKFITLTTRTSGGTNVVGVSCANGNSSYLQGDSGAQISITGQLANIGGTSVPTITTQPLSGSNTNEIATTAWATTKLSGYALYNAPFICNYNTLGTLPIKVNQDIGYIWSIAGTSFTSWNGYTTANNVYTIAWNGTGDKTIGVWRMDISLVTNTATTMTCGLNVNIVSGTTFSSNTRTVFDSSASGAFLGYQVLRLSTTLDIQNLTTTYYINFQRTGGSGLSDNTGASQILFTRIA